MRRSLIWLHRIGYVTTAIVALELLGVAAMAIRFGPEVKERRAFALAQTRTHAGPLKPDEVRFRPDQIDVLSTLPRMDAPNGLRFAAMPSLRDPWFAYSLSVPSHGDRAEGTLNILPRQLEDEGPGAIRTIKFTMPLASARALLSKVSGLTKDWAGEESRCLDGTRVAFEFVADGIVTSGVGNSACSEHYGRISLLVLNSVKNIIPKEVRPAGKSWRINSTS